jgi:hypothetical protein
MTSSESGMTGRRKDRENGDSFSRKYEAELEVGSALPGSLLRDELRICGDAVEDLMWGVIMLGLFIIQSVVDLRSHPEMKG